MRACKTGAGQATASGKFDSNEWFIDAAPVGLEMQLLVSNGNFYPTARPTHPAPDARQLCPQYQCVDTEPNACRFMNQR